MAPPRLRLALGLSLVAACAAAVAPVLGVLRAAPPPGFASGPVLLVLAALPVALAFGLVAADRAVTGARVLVGAALLAPGAFLIDLQLVIDSTKVARPELLMPTSLARLEPSLGMWLLLGAHVVAVAAGIAAAGLAGAVPGSEYAEAVENPEQSRSFESARRMLGLSAACGVLVAVGLLMPALYSHDALLVAVDVVPNPWLVRAGGVVLAVTVPIALAWSAGTGNPRVHRGMSLGVLAAIAAVAVPPLAAGAFMDRVGDAPGPMLAIAGAVLAVAVSLLPVRSVSDEDTDAPRHEVELTLRANRLHQGAGLLGVLVGGAAVISAFGTVYTVTALAGGVQDVVGEPIRLGLAAGLLVAVLGLLVAVSGPTGSAVRPAFVVALGALPLPATIALDDALGATKVRDSLQGAQFLPGAGEQVVFGPGFWLSIAVLLGAAVAAIVVGLAGGAEREELDLTDRPDNQILWAPVVLAALLAVGAFGLPVLRAPGFRAPGIWSNFTLASAGLLLSLLAVLAATLLAPYARPARAAALLLGAAGVLGVRVVQLPMTKSTVPGSVAGTGWWLALATAALLVVAAVVAATAKPPRPVRGGRRRE